MKQAIVLLDPELRDIERILSETFCHQGGSSSVAEEDRIFRDRLRSNPFSLKLSYWKDHFEWKSLLEYPEMGKRILDFGCGTGHSDIFLARNGYAVHGIDVSEAGIRIAMYLRARENAKVQQLLSFAVADVTADDPPEERFPSVWASHVFEHIADPGPVLRGLSEWVEPRAYLLVSVPLGHAFDDPSHVHHFGGASALAAHLEEHVDVVRVETSQGFPVIRALCRFR